MTLTPGARLGAYEVLGLIGAGGMGEVYRARDTRLGRTVAIKVLPADVASDPERRRRFEQEARAASALNHPHICSLFDIGDAVPALPQDPSSNTSSVSYLVMEYLEGQTLTDRLSKGPLPLEQALAIGAQIADALAAAHKQGIIHRDLKPANVMLTKGGAGSQGGPQAKLLDFGLARLTESSGTGLESATQSASGVVVGTVPYMAPEQVTGRPADARTDLFAFGAVLYEMLTGARAFGGDSSAAVMAAILEHEPPALATLQPRTPPALERLVKRCMAKDPDARWDTAHDVADELRWISQRADTTAVAGASRSHGRGRWWVLAAVLALVVAAAGISTLWLSGVWRPSVGSRLPSAITSVAVLPLENLSGDPSQEYFADGLTDSLINELAQIRALRVISRTSVMRYKGTRKPLKEIARELNDVGAIVEGTVMRDAGRVAVTVKLIDTASDAHVWSRDYDRDLIDILTLRREIAMNVAEGIRAALQPEDERRLSKRETVNPDAFDAFLRAIELRTRGDTAANARAAREAARKAISLSNRFTQGYVELAHASANLWWFYWDHSPDRASEARSAANTALLLDPQLPDAHRAKGIVLYQLDFDYEGALKEFSLALDGNPSDSQSFAYVGYIKRRQGKLDETLTYQEDALALNPLDGTLWSNLGETYALLRRPDDAERNYDKALSLNPQFSRAWGFKLRWRLRLRPELAQAGAVERQAEVAGLGTDPIVLYHRVLLRILAGDHAQALGLLARSPVDVFEDQFWYVPTTLLEAQIYERLGQRGKALERFAKARRVTEAGLRADPGDARCHGALGLALAGLGQKTAAVREGRAAVEAMPVAKDAVRGAYRLEDLARIYATVGERDAAVELLTKLLTMPFELAAPALALDPAWAPMRGHPGFERLVASSSKRR